MWSKMYIKSRIEKKNNVFIVVITYSFFMLYNYDEVSIHSTLDEAQRHLIELRTQGHHITQID